MTATDNNTNNTRRKKRLLTSSRDTLLNKIPNTQQDNPSTNTQPKKKKKRLLNQPQPPPTVALSPTAPLPPIITTPKPTEPATKRSIRAASEAIAKREKERQDVPLSPSPPPLSTIEERQPIVKRKRKLNSQKVVIPTNESSPDALVFEETGDVSYAKYLDSPSTKQIPNNPKPAIVIGVPTKKRKLVKTSRPATPTATIITTSSTLATKPIIKKPDSINTPIQEEMPERTLDLSQHSILPNSSYIAHLPMSQQQKNRERSTTSTSYSSEGSMLYTMDNSTVGDSPSIFFDAISDFEDMTLHSQAHSEQDFFEPESEQELAMESTHIKQEPATNNYNFWSSILKPFTRD